MDFKLHGEAPVFKRCCFCLPLRRGLLGCGYARLVLDILVIVNLITYMFILAAFHVPFKMFLSFIAAAAFFLTDVGFTVLLIFAGHKKNSKLLRISYIYSTSWLILELALGVFGVGYVANSLYATWQYNGSHTYLFIELGMCCAFLFSVVFVQIYVILMTRSEAIKLQNQSLEMQFVNNATEAEARCVSTEQRCTDNGHTSVQDTDDAHDTSVQYTDDVRGTSVPNTGDGHDTSVRNMNNEHDSSVQNQDNERSAPYNMSRLDMTTNVI